MISRLVSLCNRFFGSSRRRQHFGNPAKNNTPLAAISASQSRSLTVKKEGRPITHPLMVMNEGACTEVDPVKIERFRIRGLLGTGSGGKVYAAIDNLTGRKVALKVVRAIGPDDLKVRRLAREASIAAKLNHENIVACYDKGVSGDLYWVSYRLVVGQNLKRYIRDKTLPELQIAQIAHQIALALDHGHQKNIIHRDVKPSNIIIDRNNDVHLIDFGAAREVHTYSSLTCEGRPFGTFHYMSPEAFHGDINAINEQSDIYSLGVIVYELICGRKPLDYPRTDKSIELSRLFHPIPPKLHNPLISTTLEKICLKAISQESSERYSSASDLAAELAAWITNLQQ